MEGLVDNEQGTSGNPGLLLLSVSLLFGTGYGSLETGTCPEFTRWWRDELLRIRQRLGPMGPGRLRTQVLTLGNVSTTAEELQAGGGGRVSPVVCLTVTPWDRTKQNETR